MPSATQFDSFASNPKKRRREEGSDTSNTQFKLSSPQRPPFRSPPRGVLISNRHFSNVKRSRIDHLNNDLVIDEASVRHERAPSGDSYLNLPNVNEVVRMIGQEFDLSPCHICRRKPTLRSELDAFADCESCGERTCYICIRNCEGFGIAARKSVESLSWASNDVDRRKRGGFVVASDNKLMDHRGKICSRCCVERGAQGEVWCLSCLRAKGNSQSGESR